MKRSFFLTFILFVSFLLPAEDYFSIGITWMGSSLMAEEVTEGAIEIFSDLVPDLNIEVMPALKSRTELRTLLDRYIRQKDGVVLLRSSGAEFLSQNLLPVPSFFGAANDPVALEVVENPERPGGNVTGVSYYIPMEKILSFIYKLVPDLTTLLLIYEEGHPGSDVERLYLERICGEYDITYLENGVSQRGDILEAVERYKDEADLVIVGNQNYFINRDEEIKAIAGVVPTFSFNPNLVSKGVLASLSSDNKKLGRLLAGSIISVLYGGKKVGDIPVKFDEDPGIHININTSEELGILIPIHLLRVMEVYR